MQYSLLIFTFLNLVFSINSWNFTRTNPLILKTFPKPSKNSDGTCYAYEVKSGDSCYLIANNYSLTQDELIKFNENHSYNWEGCDKLAVGQGLCLSEGSPPKPKSDPNAECGPYAPGDWTTPPECPNKACCSKWGYCGITSEFCEKDTGCFSNCGYGKLHGDTRSDFENIAYWMDSDDSLASDPLAMNDKYSKVHYAFVNIRQDFSIDDYKFGVSKFLNIKPKKIASFGGWDFSTNPETYNIFREGVKKENRDKLTTNIANFANNYNLDGIDIDWEYPAEPDIPNIPADNKDSIDNYVEFIKLLKSKLGSKTLSIAIPSSFWYLKGFKLKELDKYIDYKVFMTYDIYGVWDEQKDNHIRCHANKTAIIDAMKMLDKAESQIGNTYVGISNYGRSYKVSSSSCLKENCAFNGPGNARSLTNTPGVLSDSEIIDINASSDKNDRWTDSVSDCIFMRYDEDSIVSWTRNRNDLINFIKSHGFKGSVLWAENYYKHDFIETEKIPLNYDYEDTEIKAKIVKDINLDFNTLKIYKKMDTDLTCLIDIFYFDFVQFNFDQDKLEKIVKFITLAKINKGNNEIDPSIFYYSTILEDSINGLISEAKKHAFVNNKNCLDENKHDELRKRADYNKQINYILDYQMLFIILTLAVNYDIFIRNLNNLRDQLINEREIHYAHLNSLSRGLANSMSYNSINTGNGIPSLEGGSALHYYNIINNFLEENIQSNTGQLNNNIEEIEALTHTTQTTDISSSTNIPNPTHTGSSQYYTDLPNLSNFNFRRSIIINDEDLNRVINLRSNGVAVHIVNIFNDSPGVAATALRYLSNNFNDLEIDPNTGGVYMCYIMNKNKVPNKKRGRTTIVRNNNIDKVKPGEQVDEFPYYSTVPTTRQNIIGTSDESYLNTIEFGAINGIENRIDGNIWGKRVNFQSYTNKNKPNNKVNFNNLLPVFNEKNIVRITNYNKRDEDCNKYLFFIRFNSQTDLNQVNTRLR